ncbi:unnamed protein product, partial [Sphacelaria rigidula]
GLPLQWLSFDVNSVDLAARNADDACSGRSGSCEEMCRDTGIGQGYDQGVPSVYRAKEQYFAIAFIPCAERAEEEWRQEQDRRVQQQQQGEDRALRETEEAIAAEARGCLSVKQLEMEPHHLGFDRNDAGSGSGEELHGLATDGTTRDENCDTSHDVEQTGIEAVPATEDYIDQVEKDTN